MKVLQGIVAVLFLAALVAAGAVVSHGTPVRDAGQPYGYEPPVVGQKLLVLGDSFSMAPTNSDQQSWDKILTASAHMTPITRVAAGRGYLTSSTNAPTFQKSAENLGNSIKNTDSNLRPDWAIVWGAYDDIRALLPTKPTKHQVDGFTSKLVPAMQRTLRLVQSYVPKGHLIVVGPAGGPLVDPNAATKIDAAEESVATQLDLHYISPVQRDWFSEDPHADQDNGGFISVDGTPTDAGQVHILHEMEIALKALPHVTIAENALDATDPLPPVLPTQTRVETSVSLSTTVRTSVTPVTRTAVSTATVPVTRAVPGPVVTVTPPPVIVTVTVPASSPGG